MRLVDLSLPDRKLRKIDPAHVNEVAGSISALGFCVPILIGKNNVVVDGAIRLEAAKALGLGTAPCIRIEHLSDDELRLLRLAVNRLGEKGEWNLDELKFEFEELMLTDAPLEISGFSWDEIDPIILGDELAAVERGPLGPDPRAVPVARRGDLFQLGPHRLICGDSTEPETINRLFEGDDAARIVMTDEPYNRRASQIATVPRRDFAMARGEMSEAQFLEFNLAWMKAALVHLTAGGIFGTFIDWRSQHTVRAAKRRVRSASRRLARIHHRFATIYAAGALAIEFGILPWDRASLGELLIACELAHVALVEGKIASVVAEARAEDPLDRLEDHVRDHGASFVDLRDGLIDPDGNHDHDACDGYVNQRDHGTIEFLFSEAKLQDVCGGKAQALRAKKRLDEAGWLVRDTARPCTRRTIWAEGDHRREQVIAIRAKAFEAAGAATQ